MARIGLDSLGRPVDQMKRSVSYENFVRNQ